MDREYRLAVEPIGLEERADSNELVLTALAHRTGVRATIFDFTEEISPGAFKASIPRSDIVLNTNHGRSSGVLARTSSGTMKVWESAEGLMLRAVLALEDPEGASTASKIRRGDLSALSFAFNMEGGKQVWDDSGELAHRQIERVGELFDVSVVERPAFEQTEIIGLRDARAARLSRDFGQAESDMRRSLFNKARLR